MRYGLDILEDLMNNVVVGTNTAALCIDGQPNSGPPWADKTNMLWNGTSWTEQNDTNTGRSMGGGSGTTTLAIVFAGDITGASSFTANTETWNGTSWTEVGDLAAATANVAAGSVGATSSSTFTAGGVTPGASMLATTQEFDGAPVTAKTVTVS